MKISSYEVTNPRNDTEDHAGPSRKVLNRRDVLLWYLYSHQVDTKLVAEQHQLSMDSGSITWKVEQSTLKAMKESKVAQSFQTQPFYIAGFPWRIVVSPNGTNKKRDGCFGVSVLLVNMPSEWDSIQCCIRAQCNETMASGCIVSPYKKGESWKWPGRTMLFSEIQSLNSLSISVHIFVIKIMLKRDKFRIQQSVKDPRMMMMMGNRQFPFEDPRMMGMMGNRQFSFDVGGAKPVLYQRDNTLDIESADHFVEWIIAKELLEKVKNAPDGGKRFTSEIYGGMYFIEFIRNGSHFDFKWKICATPKVNLSCTLTATMGITHEVMEYVCNQMARDLEVIIPTEVVNVVKQYFIPGKQVTKSFTAEVDSIKKAKLAYNRDLKSLLNVDDVKEHECLVLKVRCLLVIGMLRTYIFYVVYPIHCIFRYPHPFQLIL